MQSSQAGVSCAGKSRKATMPGQYHFASITVNDCGQRGIPKRKAQSAGVVMPASLALMEKARYVLNNPLGNGHDEDIDQIHPARQ